MANWENITSRGNVEDRRSFAPIAGGLSITSVVLVMLFNYLAGGDLNDALGQLSTIQNQAVEQQQNTPSPEFDGEDNYEVFASTVLGSNNDMWKDVFQKAGKDYTEPKLVLFRRATESKCGNASSQVGPHYCPYDETIYLDESFFEEMQKQLGAKGGDVAEAYVIAHEVAHHAQNQLGIMDEVMDARGNNSREANDLSIKLELQADCFAGLWAYSIKDQNVLETGEIEEAIDAAETVGDDRIQEAMTGEVNPETWTHGSSEQRKAWFNKGFQSGNVAECNTFQ